MKASDILRVKGQGLYTASPETSLWAAIDTMADADIGSLVVLEHGNLVGILTFREVIASVRAQRGRVDEIHVGEVMERSPLTVAPATDVNDVRRAMLERHARYVPVMDGTRLDGVISFHDVARAVLEEERFENQMLKAYIRDWPVPAETGH
jgi:CBS domain-containing protein